VENRRVIVVNKTAVPALAKLFATTSLPVLRAWAAFHLVDNAAPFLSDSFVQAHFAFHGKALTGKQTPPPRWHDAIRLVPGGDSKTMEESRGSMGDAVGRLYVARWFNQRSQETLHVLIANLEDALKARIVASDWMSPATRAEALSKVSDVRIEIGTSAHGDEYAGFEDSPQ
jgi:putative endopeptidase